MSFIKYSPDCDFPLENLPYGIFSTKENETHRIGVAIGDLVLDLKKVATSNLFEGTIHENREVFTKPVLNDFMAMGREFWRDTRYQLQCLLLERNKTLQGAQQDIYFLTQKDVTMHLPANIGDYTDFYSSLHHATNVGSMFRSPDNPLPPNWRHLPIAYHGRASSVVVSNTPIHRPYGQICPVEGEPPIFEPSRLMDFELEVAFFFGGPPTQLGTPIKMINAAERVFGFVLMNDWSARDIQKWEYFPLGPFLAKNVGTTISPWIVTLDALAPFMTENAVQRPIPLPYLRHDDPFNFYINLTVELKSNGTVTTISKTNFEHLYWTPKQQLVHHSTSGCNMNPGDLLGSGTISGPDPSSYGSMLELSWKGTKPITLNDGTTRRFLQDYDEIIIRGQAENECHRIGFGECAGKLLPAIPL